MSDSAQPQRREPTRFPRPWDSPGKHTGVGCHFLLQCMKVKSESEVAQSCLTLSNRMDCSPPGSSVHGIFQAKVLEWGVPFTKLEKSCLSGLIFITLSSTALPSSYLNHTFPSLEHTHWSMFSVPLHCPPHPPWECVFSMSFNCWLYFIIQVLAQVSTLSPVNLYHIIF